MNVFVRWIVASLFVVSYGMTMYPMLPRARAAVKPVGQRSYFQAGAMHKLDVPIKKTKLAKFNLAHGLALIESETLPNLYDAATKMHVGTPEDVPILFQVIKKMFHRVGAGGEIAITKSIANVATFITPDTMGILIGSIESNEIEKGRKEFVIGITDEWDANQEVQSRLAEKEGKKYANKFKRDIEVFFDLVTSTKAREDKDALYAVLLAFLYKKIHHEDPSDEFHDWMHFIERLNEYIPVFSAEKLDAVHRKLLQTSDTPSRFKSTLFSVKSKVITPELVSSSTYTRFLTHNFPLVVSDIIEKIRKQSVYPPVVISGIFGYKGQPKKADCVESATREVLLNLFYDNEKGYFDTSKYPHLSIAPKLREYLAVCNPTNMNTPAMGQLFFDMVSDRAPLIQYSGDGNYEMISTEHNILTMLNILLGIQAVNWDDLGIKLTEASGNDMEINCSKSTKSDAVIIDIIIFDKRTSAKRYLTLSIEPRHSHVIFPNDQEIKKSINLQYLLEQDTINPQIKSIFYLNPNVTLKLSNQQIECFGPLLYCSWPVRSPDEKLVVIKKIMQGHAQDPDAVQYAYGLFKSLDPLRMELLLNPSLFIAYCNDKDAKFINDTRDAFLHSIGLAPLASLLEQMPFNEAKKLLLSVINEERFNTELMHNPVVLWNCVEAKYGNGMLAYIVENKLGASDFELRNVLMQQIISKLSNNNFIRDFHTEYPLALDSLLDVSMDFAQTYMDKRNVCHFLLHQNIDSMDAAFYAYFYRKLFTLYISLLNKDYFDNIKVLGDIRLRLKKGSEEYVLYDKAMNAAKGKAIIQKE